MPVRETSKIAYRHICESGELDASCVRVYCWLFHNGPATGNEVVHGVGEANRRVPSQARARLTKLKERGVVMVVGKVTCPISHATAYQWDVTSNLPNKPRLSLRTQRMTKAQLEVECNRLKIECDRRAELATRWKRRAVAAGWTPGKYIRRIRRMR